MVCSTAVCAEGIWTSRGHQPLISESRIVATSPFICLVVLGELAFRFRNSCIDTREKLNSLLRNRLIITISSDI